MVLFHNPPICSKPEDFSTPYPRVATCVKISREKDHLQTTTYVVENIIKIIQIHFIT